MKSIETLARVNVLCVDKTGTITENPITVQKLLVAKNETAQKNSERIKGLISDYAKAMASDNVTMEAIQDYFTDYTDQEVRTVQPFSSVQKFSSVSFSEGTYVLGAPEMVLQDSFRKYQKEFSHYTEQGYRVLVFGAYPQELTEMVLEAEVTPLGYILITNTYTKRSTSNIRLF